MTENQNQDRNGSFVNPYLAGTVLGLVLLASFVLLGVGLGASAGVARLTAFCGLCISPEGIQQSEYFGAWGNQPLKYYLVFMFLGTLMGGLLSAILAGRMQVRVERGGKAKPLSRLVNALIGGILAGFASRLASGCTSGQALTGSATLMTGSILYLLCVFASGYLFAFFFRRQWHD